MEGFLNPTDVLKNLKLKEDMKAADFGSGSGGWVFPLAKKLEIGKIYAIDIQEEPLSALRAKANLFKIENVETMQADIEKGTNLLEESLDLVLITNLLFEVQDKEAVLKEAKRVLKEKGRILIVDWAKDNPLTKEIERISEKEIKDIAKKLQLKTEKEFTAGLYHFCLVLVK
ncbi:MAG: class I SAM-dependent methyltransferase [Candidatus Portnoybacteria bacterium]